MKTFRKLLVFPCFSFPLSLELMVKTMNATKLLPVLLMAVLSVAMVRPAGADPLPGQILKFAQAPMIATPISDGTGTVTTYYGHDELSTAWGDPTNPGNYAGDLMADDFADNFDTPVVHVKWWGSYLGVNPPLTSARKFLIAFESDVPAVGGGFSHPGNPLLSQVVTLGPLSPSSGTFTETLVSGSNPLEPVYQYNAELKMPFDEQADTVYWLKIVALDDTFSADPLQWGWHNRDYTILDTLASPAVTPGEYLDGTLPGGDPIWHFQDDAVSGIISVAIDATGGVTMDQTGYAPQHYWDTVDGPQPIGQHSKDLAFELYTVVPEPGAIVLLVTGLVGLLAYAWRKRK